MSLYAQGTLFLKTLMVSETTFSQRLVIYSTSGSHRAQRLCWGRLGGIPLSSDQFPRPLRRTRALSKDEGPHSRQQKRKVSFHNWPRQARCCPWPRFKAADNHSILGDPFIPPAPPPPPFCSFILGCCVPQTENEAKHFQHSNQGKK